MAFIIDGKALASKIREEIKQEVSTFKEKPGLAVVMVGNNPSSEIYVRNKNQKSRKKDHHLYMLRYFSNACNGCRMQLHCIAAFHGKVHL